MFMRAHFPDNLNLHKRTGKGTLDLTFFMNLMNLIRIFSEQLINIEGITLICLIINAISKQK